MAGSPPGIAVHQRPRRPLTGGMVVGYLSILAAALAIAVAYSFDAGLLAGGVALIAVQLVRGRRQSTLVIAIGMLLLWLIKPEIGDGREAARFRLHWMSTVDPSIDVLTGDAPISLLKPGPHRGGLSACAFADCRVRAIRDDLAVENLRCMLTTLAPETAQQATTQSADSGR